MKTRAMRSALVRYLMPNMPLNDVIERAKHELQLMIDLNPAAMILVNEARCVTRCNKAFLSLLDRDDFGTVLDAPLTELLVGVDGGIIEKLFGDESFGEVEVEVRLDASRRAVLHLNAFAVLDGDAVRVVMVEDVTELRRAEAAVEALHKKEAVQALIGALMHNVNQRLTVMTVQARLIMMDLDGEGKLDRRKARENLGSIVENSEKIALLLRNIYDSDEYVTQEYLHGLNILKLPEQET